MVKPLLSRNGSNSSMPSISTYSQSESRNNNAHKNHHHHHQRKQQYEKSIEFKKELMEQCLDLIEKNDHNALAYLARTCGIPPTLRFIVWPILLKYHPLVIAPNILSNTLQFNINYDDVGSKSMKNDKSGQKQSKEEKSESRKEQDEEEDITWEYHEESKSEEEIRELISLDVSKYFMVKYNNPQFSEGVITNAILKFLAKWGKIFKYENGLTWACLSLCEWISPVVDETGVSDEVLVLPGRSFHRNSTNNNSNTNHVLQDNDIYIDLLKEYSLSDSVKERIWKIRRSMHSNLKFADLYERLMLVILHSPDIKTIIENKKSKKSNNLYTPLISGGDFNYNHSIFYKIFELSLNELYQPFTDQLINSRNRWIYYWLKFSSVRSFHKVDRGRIWDALLGWRPNPENLSFYLKYNNKFAFDHLYSNNVPESWNVKCFHKEDNDHYIYEDDEDAANTKKGNGDGDDDDHDDDDDDDNSENDSDSSFWEAEKKMNIHQSFLDKLYKYCNNNEDYFWFPDLPNMKLNQNDSDVRIFKELMDKNTSSSFSSSSSSTSNLDTPFTKKTKKYKDQLEKEKEKDSIKYLPNTDYHHYQLTNHFPYSILDIHTQQLFIYLAILQKNEFKLLEFEEAEIIEFLNHVPILAKNDDMMYKKLYNSDLTTIGLENNVSDLSIVPSISPPTSSSSVTSSTTAATLENKIEMGTDDKLLLNFNELLITSGDIWRKWLWSELEQNTY